MSQVNENSPQATESQAEFSIDVSQNKTHVEITIPSHQVKKVLRPLALLLSHLLAAALATMTANPLLMQDKAPYPAPKGLTSQCQSIQHDL